MTTRLSRLNQRVTEFVAQRPREEEPSLAARAGKAAAVLGAGALAVGGAGYLRGRMGMGANRSNALGVLKTAKAGFGKFAQDGRNAVGAVKSAFAPAPGPQLALPAPAAPSALATPPSTPVAPVAPTQGELPGFEDKFKPRARLTPGSRRVFQALPAGRVAELNAKLGNATFFAKGDEDDKKGKFPAKKGNPFAKGKFKAKDKK